MTVDPTKLLAILDQWKQGDYTFDFQSYFIFSDLNAPCTELSRNTPAEGQSGVLLTGECVGVMMLSQTCDIIKSPDIEPYVEVCAIFQTDEEGLKDVKKWGKPLKVNIPTLEEGFLIADLSRVMTIEKGALLNWKRHEGFPDDNARKNLSRMLERKVGRFAFPDTINPWVTKLKRRLRDKIDKDSPEGNCIRGINQLRLRARPSWDQKPRIVDFIFLLESDVTDDQRKSMLPIIETFMDMVVDDAEYQKGDVDVKHFSEISAADYLGSEMLDVVLLS